MAGVTVHTWVLVLAIMAIGYLIGSIPTANIFMHLFTRGDLRRVGTGNVTSTALIIHAGKLPGALSILGEVLKTVVCLAAAGLLVGELWGYLLMMLAATIGQRCSVWLGWTGGQAQTIFVVGFLILCPVAMALAGAVYGLALLVTRQAFLSNTIFHLAAPLCLLLAWAYNPAPFGLGSESWGYSLTCAALCAIFLARHQPDTDDIVQAEAWAGLSR